LSSNRETDLCLSSMANSKVLLMTDELEMHQTVVTDAATLRGYLQDLVILKFLSDLSPILRS